MLRLSTEMLQRHIAEMLGPIKEYCDLHEYFFEKNSQGSIEGTYIYADKVGYHIVYSERGQETMHKISDCLFEITFWAINSIIWDASRRVMKQEIERGENQREFIFTYSLRLLAKVGDNFRKAGEILIDEILKENPY